MILDAYVDELQVVTGSDLRLKGAASRQRRAASATDRPFAFGTQRAGEKRTARSGIEAASHLDLTA